MFGNLLNIAASVIPQQTITYSKFERREEAIGGVWENIYGEPVVATGSVQAVELRDYKDLGFDARKKYCRLYISADLTPTDRNTAPDRITYAGETFEVVGDTPWLAQDGWVSTYIVKVSNNA